jgi:hypothetical protein
MERNNTNLTELQLAELWNGVLEATGEGSDGEDPTRLDWLQSLLTDLSEWPKTTEDPEGAYTAIEEAREMVRQIRNLFRRAAEYDEQNGERM